MVQLILKIVVSVIFLVLYHVNVSKQILNSKEGFQQTVT